MRAGQVEKVALAVELNEKSSTRISGLPIWPIGFLSALRLQICHRRLRGLIISTLRWRAMAKFLSLPE